MNGLQMAEADKPWNVQGLNGSSSTGSQHFNPDKVFFLFMMSSFKSKHLCGYKFHPDPDHIFSKRKMWFRLFHPPDGNQMKNVQQHQGVTQRPPHLVLQGKQVLKRINDEKQVSC